MKSAVKVFAGGALLLAISVPIAKFRANGPLSNMRQFAQAFQCKAGDPMVRTDRCHIW